MMSSRAGSWCRSVVLSVVLAAGSAAHAGGEMPPGKPAEQRNAALVYWQAWAMNDDPELKGDIDWQAIGANTDAGKMPESFTKAAAALGRWNDSLEGLMRASKMPVCDFELAYENGIELLMPHLGKMRGGARLLRVDARRLLVEHKPAEAARRVAGILRMSRQLRDEGILISGLVGMAIANLGMEEGTVLVESGQLSRGDAGELIAAAAPLLEKDPHGIRAAIAGEGVIFKDWVQHKFKGPQAGKEFVELYGGMLTGDNASPAMKATMEKVKKMDGAQLAAETERMLQGYKEIDQRWDSPDAVKQFQEIWDRCERGEYGELAKIMFPSFAKSRENVNAFKARCEEFNRKLGTLK